MQLESECFRYCEYFKCCPIGWAFGWAAILKNIANFWHKCSHRAILKGWKLKTYWYHGTWFLPILGNLNLQSGLLSLSYWWRLKFPNTAMSLKKSNSHVNNLFKFWVRRKWESFQMMLTHCRLCLFKKKKELLSLWLKGCGPLVAHQFLKMTSQFWEFCIIIFQKMMLYWIFYVDCCRRKFGIILPGIRCRNNKNISWSKTLVFAVTASKNH